MRSGDPRTGCLVHDRAGFKLQRRRLFDIIQKSFCRAGFPALPPTTTMPAHALPSSVRDAGDTLVARSPGLHAEHDSSDSEAQLASPLFSPRGTCSTFSDDAGSSLDDGDSDVGDLDSSLGSPAPSVYSLTESLIRQSFRNEFGRDVQNHSDIYHLPADNLEFERLSTHAS